MPNVGSGILLAGSGGAPFVPFVPSVPFASWIPFSFTPFGISVAETGGVGGVTVVVGVGVMVMVVAVVATTGVNGAACCAMLRELTRGALVKTVGIAWWDRLCALTRGLAIEEALLPDLDDALVDFPLKLSRCDSHALPEVSERVGKGTCEWPVDGGTGAASETAAPPDVTAGAAVTAAVTTAWGVNGAPLAVDTRVSAGGT